jgi:hypothetical protein
MLTIRRQAVFHCFGHVGTADADFATGQVAAAMLMPSEKWHCFICGSVLIFLMVLNAL